MTPDMTDLVDHIGSETEWAAWLEAHPEQADELVAARRVRLLMARLARAEIVTPPDFEAQLMARIHSDVTLVSLVDLLLSDIGASLLEFINLLMSLVPSAGPSSVAAPAR